MAIVKISYYGHHLSMWGLKRLIQGAHAFGVHRDGRQMKPEIGSCVVMGENGGVGLGGIRCECVSTIFFLLFTPTRLNVQEKQGADRPRTC